MCGIFGVALKDKNKYKSGDLEKIVQILFKLSESRGKEASGLAVKSKSSIGILKSPVRASHFLKTSSYKQFFSKATDKSAREDGGYLAIIGHSRLATHGTEQQTYNNQPVIKGNGVCVHNGIIANDQDLWQKFPALKREFEVDTEVFLALLQLFLRQSESVASALQKVFEEIDGSASVAALFNNSPSLLLATNTGSLYDCFNKSGDVFVFASENYILEEFIDKIKKIDSFEKNAISQIQPGTAFLSILENFDKKEFSFTDANLPDILLPLHSEIPMADQSGIGTAGINLNTKAYQIQPELKREMEEIWQKIYSGEGLKRCTKCLLPETMTFIEFDEEGVCNYCRNYKKIEVKGEEELERIVFQYRRNDGKPNCLAPFSGGRDSSYGLHYMKKVLKLNPVAYTYDWGMMTDLGRRNVARMCGRLGVEHIIISADIRKKRSNIRKNIAAWLKKPEMGMVPLFMAGDKEFEFHTEQLRKRIKVPVAIASGTLGLENEFFKIGCAGVQYGEECYEMPFTKKLKVAKYYLSQYLRNPSYINRSLFDTIFAAYVAFLYRRPTLHLYNYIEWNEQKILSVIINQYGWEKEKDTVATWRIDDGTVPFYNYIYLTVMGLTENDVLRSKLIREGQTERDRAFQLIKEENKPRYDSLEWYARTIDFDINKAIKRINEIPKHYELPHH